MCIAVLFGSKGIPGQDAKGEGYDDPSPLE